MRYVTSGTPESAPATPPSSAAAANPWQPPSAPPPQPPASNQSSLPLPADYPTAPTPGNPTTDTAGLPQWPWHLPAPPPPPPAGRKAVRNRRGASRAVVTLLVLLALVTGFAAGLLAAPRLTGPASSLPPSAGGTPVARAADSVAGIAAQALESTVFIRATGTESASGSGMVLREDGYILTNSHVIAGATGGGGEVRVIFPDGTEEPADIVGHTSSYDIAVLKVDRDGLVPLVLANSDDVVVGDPVVAVGAPLGLEGTVTSGIVSALNRPVEAGGGGSSSFINAIQTDAAINPGNSGGPLLNLAGEVVGINTAIAQAGGRATGNIGLGFAIPANQARRTAEQLIATGQATYPVIGVALDTGYRGEGVRVLAAGSDGMDPVTPGGPADEAGIEPGDVILSFDGRPMTTAQELVVAVRARAPGDEVVLEVRRGSRVEEFQVVLGETAAD